MKRMIDLMTFFLLFLNARAKICGQGVGQNGTLQAINTLSPGEFCVFKVFPETQRKISFLNIQLMDESGMSVPCDVGKAFLLTKKEKIGPFCPKSDSVKDRHRREITDDLIAIGGDEIDVVYSIGDAGKDLKLKFLFEWEIVDKNCSAHDFIKSAREASFGFERNERARIGQILDHLSEAERSRKCSEIRNEVSCSDLTKIQEKLELEEFLDALDNSASQILEKCTDAFRDLISKGIQAIKPIKEPFVQDFTTYDYEDTFYQFVNDKAQDTDYIDIVTESPFLTTERPKHICSMSIFGKCNDEEMLFCNSQIFENSLDKNCPSKPVAVGQFMAITKKLLEQTDSCSKKFVGCDDLRLDPNLKKGTAAFKKMKQIVKSLEKRCGVEIDGMSELWDSMKCKGESGSIEDGLSSLSRSLKTPEKLCGLKQYASRNIEPFKNRLFSSSNPDRALDGFRILAEFISQAPKKCDFHRAPCDLTYFPKNENVCQLGDRAIELFKMVEKECGENVETDYGNVLKNFKEDFKPKTGKCPKTLMSSSERSKISQFKQNSISDEDIRQLVVGEIAFPGKKCSLNELTAEIPKIQKHLLDKKNSLKKSVKKIVDRADEILDYMAFANFQKKCSEEIRVPCEFLSSPRKHEEVARRIAMLSHYYSQHCDNYDFVAQYLSNAFTK